MKLTLRQYAKVVAFATLCLIFAGGLVTSTGSGLSVPDWPLSFGKFFPEMKGGVIFEHGHRMVAGTVVVLTGILLAWVLKKESRFSVRMLAIGAMGAILVQAVLGGLTVLFKLPVAVSVAHAGLAQLFFCSVVTLAWLTSSDRQKEPTPIVRDGLPSLRTLSVVTTMVIYVQILLGALMRHIGAGLAIPDFPLAFGTLIPPRSFFTFPVAVHFAHRMGALAVTAFVVWTASRVFQLGIASLRKTAGIGLVLLVLQATLGALTIWTQKAVIPTTLHVAIGALLLATHVVLMLQIWRLGQSAPATLIADPAMS